MIKAGFVAHSDLDNAKKTDGEDLVPQNSRLCGTFGPHNSTVFHASSRSSWYLQVFT
jgi:hypothetical protein